MKLLDRFSVVGSFFEREKLVRYVRGHALTLKLMGAYLREAHRCDVRRWDRIDFRKADTLIQGGHATQVLDSYVAWFSSGGANGHACLSILYVLSLFDGAVERDFLSIFLGKPIWRLTDGLFALDPEETGFWANVSRMSTKPDPIPEDERNIAFTTLANCGLLLTSNEERQKHWAQRSIDTYPLVREYFRSRAKLRKDAWRKAHSKLYSVFLQECKSELPDSHVGLGPLYNAVSHGCQAGKHLEVLDSVYKQRILRHDAMYSIRVLGAFKFDIAAISCFFETRWEQLRPGFSIEQEAWLFAKSGFYLYAVGRVLEAEVLQRKACKLNVQINRWVDASVNCSELCTTEACLGRLPDAEKSAKLALSYAERTEIRKKIIGRMTALAQILHQAGRERDARAMFENAEAQQVLSDKQHPRLYGLWGFRFSELLLAEVEHAVWHSTVTGLSSPSKNDVDRLIGVCRIAEDRTVSGVTYLSLLSQGLERLTRAKTKFFQIVLQKTEPNSDARVAEAGDMIVEAIHILRESETQEYLCRGLLLYAWFLRSINEPGSAAVRLLDEAYELAHWSPLTLCLADVHLMRAGLFYAHRSYPWKVPKDDFDRAEKLIAQCGYGQRKKALATVAWAMRDARSAPPRVDIGDIL